MHVYIIIMTFTYTHRAMIGNSMARVEAFDAIQISFSSGACQKQKDPELISKRKVRRLGTVVRAFPQKCNPHFGLLLSQLLLHAFAHQIASIYAHSQLLPCPFKESSIHLPFLCRSASRWPSRASSIRAFREECKFSACLGLI